MRILHICIYFRNPMFIGLMKAQEDLNTDKRVFYYETRKMGLKKFDMDYVDSCQSNIKFMPTPFLRFARLKNVANNMFEIYKNNHNFDCIHAHTLISDGFLALQMKKKWGIPYVITIRDSDLHFKPYWNINVYLKIINEILENASGIIVLSKTLKKTFEDLLKNKGINLNCGIDIIPNGIDEYWHNNCYNRDGIIDNNRLWKIITVGKICRRKNQIVCCRAIEDLISEGYNIEYNIIGKSEDKKILKKIKKYSFVNINDFMKKEELINKYRENDIFLLVSKNETFGLVYAEAMTQGLPVVYTKGQGFDQQFDEGKVGFSASSDSVDEIKQAIINAINNYNTITNLTPQLSKKFNWIFVAEEFNKIYKIISNR